jgi:predicted HD phosphohydrolase
MTYSDHFSPLMNDSWEYISTNDMNAMTDSDWAVLGRQRIGFFSSRADRVLSLYEAMRDESSFGYRINNFRHGLQSGTLAVQAGLGSEDVVVCLLHDIGFSICPENHGSFVAEMLKPVISEKNYWMLSNHAYFQTANPPERQAEIAARLLALEAHEYAQWAREFVAKYDNPAMDPNFETLPLEYFVPIVRQVLNK